MDAASRDTVLVVGSGPIRIGQGIEFDYSCVHCVWALQEMGYRAIIINNNPETVSTDFDIGDGLYFEPVTLDDVLRVVEHERAMGVVLQFGGQTSINLAQGLESTGVKVLGTSPAAIAAAEDRDQFERLLAKLDIPKPPGRAVMSLAEALEVALEVGFPVLVRPSFVLGGRAMEIVYSEGELQRFYREAENANPGQPVLVDRYILGTEAEVDVISDGRDTLVPGIMEHIERAGVHSGDSMAVYPPVALSADVQRQMVRSACRIAREIGVHGMMNIQFVIAEDKAGHEVAYVLEVNPRASRTVPYLSKITGVPMVQLATRTMMGQTLDELGYASGLWVGGALGGGKSIVSEAEIESPDLALPKPRFYAVKAPVFSFQKLARVEPSLGPEMKSTGEILGIDWTFETALYKALVASGIQLRRDGLVLITVNDHDKPAAVDIARELVARGFRIAATGGTHDLLVKHGIRNQWVMKISEGEPNLLDLIVSGEVALMINTPSNDHVAETEAARIRRACIERGIACVTSIDTATALMNALDAFQDPARASCLPYPEYLRGANPN